MGYVIEIREDEFDELAECAEKMLRYGGKLMSKIDQMKYRSKSGQTNERNDEMDYRDMGRDMGERMGNRGRGGHRGGYREGFRSEEDDDERFDQRRRY